MWKAILFLSVACFAQPFWDSQNARKIQGRPVASTAPSDGEQLTWDAATGRWIPGAAGGSGSGATAISGLSDLQVTRSSSTVLAIATGKARQGATTTSYSAATATLSGTSASSTAYVYITSGGVLTVGHNGAATVTCSNCTTATGISAFPADALPIATATYTTTTWDVSGITDLRAIPSRENLAAGDGITLSFGASSVTVATDPATVPVYSSGSGAPSASCTQAREFYLDTASSTLYQCTATNTWGAVGGSSLPTQSGNAGKVLETDGSSASWGLNGRVFYVGLTSDTCDDAAPNDPTTLYTFAAGSLEVGDIIEIDVQHQKPTANASATIASVWLAGTNVSGTNSMGTTDAEGWAQNRVIARITSTTEASVIGLRQRSNGSVGGTRTKALAISDISANTLAVGALATTCGGNTVEARAVIKVYKNGSR